MFLTAFGDVDKLLITDIYAASEPPLEGVTAKKLVDGIRALGHRDVEYVTSNDEVLARLADLARPGDLIMTLGAGDLNKVAAKLVERLQRGTA